MIGHISFGVRDLGHATAFYDPVMATIGFVRVWSNPTAVGYGRSGGGDKFALKQRDGASPPGVGFHLAFDAPDRATVDRFHAVALAHGGMDDGAPGLRPHYGPTYYAAFLTDPDGYRLEAVHQ
ncbi:MAG TPA: VOC family protein [Rhizomicrobium sp.]|jgi:catechol 2,3-dioxygenase-like lactoylglutathione lyase family enzyme|nr:VOC family protein [Rhizomicrobium sp.]